MSDENARKAAASFFLRVEQVGQATEIDRCTLPLFPLLMVMDPAMLDADAKFEAMKVPKGSMK